MKSLKEKTIEEQVEEFSKDFNYTHFTWNGDNATGAMFAKKSLNKVVRVFKQALQERDSIAYERGRGENILETLTYDEAIKWWLDHYEGMEHMHVNPEAMYTITSILKRCFNQIKSKTNQ